MAKVDKHRARWDRGDVDRLADMANFGMAPNEIGHVLGRTGPAIRAKAAEQDIRLDQRPLTTVRAFGRKGGVFVRDFHGGSIGVRWGRAHRSGAAFSAEACERLLDAGMIVPAEGAGQNGHVWWKRSKARKAKIG